MKKEKGMPYVPNPMMSSFPGRPESCFELINRYGTYNIQPTADSDDIFPAIAQGLPKAWEAQRIDKKAAEKEARDKGFQM